MHPFAHFLQAVEGGSRKFAIRLGTDVHQQVGILAGGIHEIMYEGLGRLIVLVCYLVAPHAVHGFTGFKGQSANVLSRQSCLVLPRQVALENLDILTFERCLVMIVAHQTTWLQAMNERILLRQLPVKVRVLVLVPPSVEPHGPNLAIVCQQFRELVVHELVIAFPVSLGIGAPCSTSRPSPHGILALPVNMRVIQVKTYALLVTLVGKFLENVTPERCGIHDIIV